MMDDDLMMNQYLPLQWALEFEFACVTGYPGDGGQARGFTNKAAATLS
jgi:hypothetical protein